MFARPFVTVVGFLALIRFAESAAVAQWTALVPLPWSQGRFVVAVAASGSSGLVAIGGQYNDSLDFGDICRTSDPAVSWTCSDVGLPWRTLTAASAVPHRDGAESDHCGKHLHCGFLTPMFLTRPMMSDVELGRGASEVAEWKDQSGVEEGLMSGITTKGQDGIGMMVVPVQSAGCFATSAQLGLLERSAVTPAGLAAWKAGTSPAAQHGGGT